MKTPNIFEYATSELSQDAALAYVLAWADPEYKNTEPKLHALGDDLLRALLEAVAEHDTSPVKKIDTVLVKTQVKNVDVLVTINASKHLIIEDKVNAKKHSNQIKRYKKKFPGSVAVYLKTGNESKHTWPTKGNDNCDGLFFR